MTQKIRFLDRFRRSGTEYERNLIEGAFQGRVSRRELLRHGSVLGMSLTMLESISLAAGLGGATMIRPAFAAPGGTLKIASGTPSTALDPVIVPDSYGLAILQQTGEYLAIDGPDLVLRPCLATSWSPNSTGTVWTFKIRTGVKFHDGTPLDAHDVAVSWRRVVFPPDGVTSARRTNFLMVDKIEDPVQRALPGLCFDSSGGPGGVRPCSNS